MLLATNTRVLLFHFEFPHSSLFAIHLSLVRVDCLVKFNDEVDLTPIIHGLFEK